MSIAGQPVVMGNPILPGLTGILMAKKKRVDYHEPVIEEIQNWGEGRQVSILQFSLGRSMVNPTLVGVPDLEIITGLKTVWVEIKPKYASGRLARLSEGQVEWFWRNQDLFKGTYCNAYAILTGKRQWSTAWQWLTQKNWNTPNIWVQEDTHKRQLRLT